MLLSCVSIIGVLCRQNPPCSLVSEDKEDGKGDGKERVGGVRLGGLGERALVPERMDTHGQHNDVE